jgi:hypothetical protein
MIFIGAGVGVRVGAMLKGKTDSGRPKVSKTKLISGVILTLLVLLGGVALYTFATLKISYSDGDRSGLLQKFSRKGWVCKTYEGELALSYVPGVAPVLWYFSVRDEAVAQKVNQGLGKKVVVHYTEHHGVPTECFGETDYFVDGLRVVE